MFNTITISKTRENNDEIKSKKRLTQLKKLKVADVNNIILNYNIQSRNINNGFKANKDLLINAVIIHEKMSLGGRQTEIIDTNNKSYWIQTETNLVSIKKERLIVNDVYHVNVNFCLNIANMEVSFDRIKKQYLFKGVLRDNIEIYKSILRDVKSCSKSLIFMESIEFCFKINLFMSIYSENEFNDIKRNIILFYLDRSLKDYKDIRCKLL